MQISKQDKNSDAIEYLENEKTILDVLIEQIDKKNIDNLYIKIEESTKQIEIININKK